MDFTAVINSIRTALYGSEVRESIASGMEWVKKFADSASDQAALAVNQAAAAKKSADASADSAAAAARSQSAAAGSATEASGSASAAEKSKTAAATSESNAAKHEEASKKYSEEAGAKAGTDKTLSIENAPADAAAVRKLIEDSLAAQRAEDYAKIKFWVSPDPTSPAALFGGTWEQLKDVFLLAAGDIYEAGTTGGEAEHTLTEAELPTIYGYASGFPKWNGYTKGVFSASTNGGTPSNVSDSTSGWMHFYNLTMSFGSGKAHNTMPPYLAVYAWKRIA